MSLDKPLNLDFDTEPEFKAERHQESRPASPSIDAPQSEESTNAVATEIETLKQELQAKGKQLEAKDQEISELKIKNRQLLEENRDTQARQKLMEEELGKAEAQIELIQELLLNDEESEESTKHE